MSTTTRWNALTPVPASEAWPTGYRLGHFELGALLGRGGMGDVYVARQIEPVQREVALKILPAGASREETFALLRFEARMQASLQHPVIAQLYEVGEAPNGAPYIAMELVDGEPIDAYCRLRRIPLLERLRLFVEVCHGVAHAHGRGVIHRDLKPDNILVLDVDGQAHPKVIDFGIAMAMATGESPAGLAGTLQYMSPEQCDGNLSLVDIRADVFALGRVLDVVLGLTAPDSDPAIGWDGGRMGRDARRELAAIVHRASAEHPGDRYMTVPALIEDLERMLGGWPVAALAPTRAYVWRKFARRHRFQVALGTIALLGVCLALGVQAWSIVRIRAEHARLQESLLMSTAAIDFLLDDVIGVRRPRGSEQSVEVRLDAAANAMKRDRDIDPLNRAQLMKAIAAGYRDEGRLDKAENALRGALGLETGALGSASSAVLATQLELSRVLEDAGRYKEAEAIARSAFNTMRGQPHADDDQYVQAQHALGSLLGRQGRIKEARTILLQAQRLASERLGADHPRTRAVAAALAALDATGRTR